MNINLKTSTEAIEEIKIDEGFRSKAYLCPAGIPTIGYGSTVIDGKPVKMGISITKEKATEQLLLDVSEKEQSIFKLVKVPITQEMLDALVSFVYNLGAGSLKTSTLLKLLNNKEYDKVPAQFLRWDKARNPKTKRIESLPGLTKRRKREATRFEEGIKNL